MFAAVSANVRIMKNVRQRVPDDRLATEKARRLNILSRQAVCYLTRSQAVARIADRTASQHLLGVTWRHQSRDH